MTLGQTIELVTQRLPEGWRIRIDVSAGTVKVTAIRPDGTDVIFDDEDKLEYAVNSALRSVRKACWWGGK